MRMNLRVRSIATLLAALFCVVPYTLSAQLDETPLTDEVAAAKRDLVARVPNLGTGEIDVIIADRITWNDSSFGCPEPGRMYTMAQAPGYKIILEAHGVYYHYHGIRGRPPEFCTSMGPFRQEVPQPGSRTR